MRNPYSKITRLGLILLLLPSWLLAREVHDMDDQHHGVLSSGNVQIFPENRTGNGLYQSFRLLVTLPDQTIKQVEGVEGTLALLYLSLDRKNNLTLGVYDGSPEKQVKLKQVDAEFYEFSDRTTSVRKVYRIFNGKLTGVYPRVRTAAHVTPSPTHVAFYHITESRTESLTNEQGQSTERRVFSFRIHIVKRSETQLHTLLNTKIDDVQPFIEMAWVDDKTLSYTLSNGESKQLNLAKMLPGVF